MAQSYDDQLLLGREIEDGEVVSSSGSDTETDDEDARYYLQAPRHDEGKLSAAACLRRTATAVEEEVDSAVSAATGVDVSNVSDGTTTPVQSARGNDPVVSGGSGSSGSSSVEPGQSGAAEAVAPPQQATFIPLMVPAASQQQRVLDPAASRQAPQGRGFSCRECGRWFQTHQGLGGHAAGHKNRRLAAEAAAAGIDPEAHIACRGGARSARPHACKICGAEYRSGVSLGGHMRKHYSGKPIVPRKRQRLSIPGQLALALPLQQHQPHPAVEAPVAAPPLQLQAPPAVEAPIAAPQLPPGCVRIFGVNFVKPAN
ncbi:hypothetical protein QYE76_044067 [Lolium multiflorum]|uniref:C2H2-type domain-containing protein n=1 Tax=Lolium multiflorum TaxID=4521 RepID=A0AAD8TK81_LOLMU|nr:hypothetical protein QYE76_044067 [Lolium multiflorum]